MDETFADLANYQKVDFEMAVITAPVSILNTTGLPLTLSWTFHLSPWSESLDNAPKNQRPTLLSFEAQNSVQALSEDRTYHTSSDLASGVDPLSFLFPFSKVVLSVSSYCVPLLHPSMRGNSDL